MVRLVLGPGPGCLACWTGPGPSGPGSLFQPRSKVNFPLPVWNQAAQVGTGSPLSICVWDWTGGGTSWLELGAHWSQPALPLWSLYLGPGWAGKRYGLLQQTNTTFDLCQQDV